MLLVLMLVLLGAVQGTDLATDYESCKPAVMDFQDNFEEYQHWANSIPALVAQDKKRKHFLMDQVGDDSYLMFNDLRRAFYRSTSQTLQTHCSVMKRMGGKVLASKSLFYHFDCQKMVCMDKLYNDIVSGQCLVYSFGLGDDWSFEIAMADLGCKVKAFDPTDEFNGRTNLTHPNIEYFDYGLNHVDQQIFIKEKTYSAYTMKTILNKLGDQNKRLSFLKVDIEGYELMVLETMITDHILEKVDQLQIELHTYQGLFDGETDFVLIMNNVLQQIKAFYDQGMYITAYEANKAMAKKEDFPLKIQYHTFFDVLFYRS